MKGPQDGAASAPAAVLPWAGGLTSIRDGVPQTVIDTTPDQLQDICRRLTRDPGYRFATLVVEQTRAGWQLNYLFSGNRQGGIAQVVVHSTGPRPQIPSITGIVHAADWHERETEDLFGLGFEGHPRLGDFVLHEHWPEGINPMRPDFDAAASVSYEEICPWQPDRIAQAPGAFVMPVGPVYSDFAESAHFLLETVGEDVIRVIPRLFYKYRGVEKLAEGQCVENVLLLTERFSGTSAFAHSLGFCQAVEAICAAKLPARAKALRVFLAELERCRHHVGVITEICGSTGLAVATSQAAILEEELLRLSGQYTGHRYLFGLNVAGGLSLAMEDDACQRLAEQVSGIVHRLGELQEMLRFSSSFLDRIEEVGAISRKKSMDYGLVGPISRASGVGCDLRIDLPYAFYGNDSASFTMACEQEGDGYARLRLFFAEAVQSARIMDQIARSLPPGKVRCPLLSVKAGAALGWAEAPRGAAFHWVRIAEDGQVVRYRVTPPSFANWHGFHLAAENFAFQDFPIIMATFALSNAECDR